MNKAVVSVLIATFAILSPLSGFITAAKAAPPVDHPGRDAFSKYPVYSTEALVKLVNSDAKLRKRYAKHFHVTESEVVAFIRDALVLKKVPATRQITVYGVTKSGRIYPVTSKLRKGQLVWATRVGDPVLKWACANPLVARLPGPQPGRIARLSAPPKKTPKTRVMPLGIKVKAPEQSSSLANIIPVPPTTDTVHGLGAEGANHMPIPMAMIKTPSNTPPAGVVGFHTGNPGLGLPIALAALGAVILSQDNNGGGGGGDTGGGNTGGGNTGGDTGGGGPPPVAIPETGTFVLVAAVGIPALLYRLRKR